MQLNREELIKAFYQGMCRIREFEDVVHEEFASGALLVLFIYMQVKKLQLWHMLKFR